MAQQIINVGTNPNDGTGDTLRGAFVKTDDNFTELYSGKQDTLVSGTNIKTINSTSLLGSGNVSVQATLVSGTNIKTINGNSLLGSGDLTISGGITGSGTDNYIPRFNGTTALENSIIFDNATNVGIGTASPVDKLDINGSLRLRGNTANFAAANNSGVIDFVPTSIFPTDPQMRIVALGSSTVGASIAFQTGVNSGSITERMRITPTGYVGIGTSTPSSNLHVVGSNDQILIGGGTTQSLTSVAGGSMISYNDSIYQWSVFNGALDFNINDQSFYLSSILITDLGGSVNFGAKRLPNSTSFTNSSYETLIGVYDDTTSDWETGIYAKRNIYCGAYDTTTILTIAEPNSSVDLVAKIGYGSRLFIAKISLMIDWDALTYTYKITNTNTTNFDDGDSLNINFEFAFSGAEFVVQINNNTGNDIYPNINANIL